MSKNNINAAVEGLSNYASMRGLSHESLDELIDILTTPSKLDQITIKAILRHLYPRHTVAEAIAVKIVGCFGQGKHKPALSTQARYQKPTVLRCTNMVPGPFVAMVNNGLRHA